MLVSTPPAPRWWARGRAPQPRPPLHAAHAPYTRGARTPLSPQPFQMLPGFAIISAAFTLTGFGVYGLSYIKWGWKVRRARAVPHPRRPLPLARSAARGAHLSPLYASTRARRAAAASREGLFRLQDGDARRAPPQEVDRRRAVVRRCRRSAFAARSKREIRRRARRRQRRV